MTVIFHQTNATNIQRTWNSPGSSRTAFSYVHVEPSRGASLSDPELSRLGRALRRITPHKQADQFAGFSFRDLLVLRLRALANGRLKPPADHWLEYWLLKLEHQADLNEEPLPDD